MKATGILFRPELVVLLSGDVVAALLLSQIAYWFQPATSGHSKLRVVKGGHRWLAKSAPQWHAEIGLSEKQARRAVEVLRSEELILTKVMRFAGSPTVHIRLTEHGRSVLALPKS